MALDHQLFWPILIGLALIGAHVASGRLLASVEGTSFAIFFQRRPLLELAGSVVFLFAQLGLIYWMGYASIPVLALVIVILGALAFGAKSNAIGPVAGHAVVTAMFLTYIAYWLVTKYVPSPDIFPAIRAVVPNADKGLQLIGFLSIVGVSYLGFKLLHFYFDYRAGEIQNVSVPEFLSWLLFFPSIVAGPMQRFQDWQADRANIRISLDEIGQGIMRITLGLFMKVVVADSIYALTLPAMGNGTLGEASFAAILGAACLYTVYLYFDFAGYSHMAIGMALFWGVRLPENFNHPFLSRNLSDFWNRWHISLSTIFRQYIFYPLSLALKRSETFRRRAILSAIIPPLVTFFIVGAWHGAGLNYLIMGLLHGIGIAWLTLLKMARFQSPVAKWWAASNLGYVVGVIITFLYITLTLVFFGLPWDRLMILFGRMG